MTSDEKYKKYKELLATGMTKQAIGLELGYKGKTAGSSLKKFIDKQEGGRVVTSNKKLDAIKNGVKKTENENQIVSDDSRGQLQTYFQDIENMEILKRIIEREKTVDDKVRQQEYLLIDDDILEGDNVRTTIRLDKYVDAEFSKFCNKNRHLANKYHIMSQAIREYMKKFT